MHPLEREILALCQANGLFLPGERLLVGVSGGPDSMALLHLLARLAPSLEVTLVVAHADHGLRPEASLAEEELVRQEAASLGIPCQVGHLAVRQQATASGASLEEAARDLRYGFFATIATSFQASKVVVAHTADDQAEEVLLRLIRGSGRKGLSGMTLLREGTVVRPLLTTDKARLLGYLRERGIPFCQDLSNNDRRYLRNRVRLDLLPYLTRFNPNIKQTLRQTATILRDEEVVLEALAEGDYHRLVLQENREGWPSAVVTRAEFNERPLAIRRRLIEKALLHLGSKPGFRQIEGLIALAATSGGGQLHLQEGLRACAAADRLSLSYPRGRRASRESLQAEPRPFRLLLPQPGRYLIPEIGREVIVELRPGRPSPEEMRESGGDLLDAGQVAFPLRIRNRLPGDRFHPLNSKGSKTVSDFLTDLKMRPEEREALPLLLSEERIVALLGVRIDHGARVTERTTEVLKVSLRPA